MWESGQWGWTDEARPATQSQQQSLHLEDLDRGSWDSAAPQSSGLHGAGFLLFLLVSPQEVLKYCPERPRGIDPHLYRPLPPPLEAPRLGGPEFMLLPLPQLLPLRPPLEGVPLPGGPPKGSSLWYPSWWSPSKELERPDFGTLWEGPGPPRPETKQWFHMWLVFNFRLLNQLTPSRNCYSMVKDNGTLLTCVCVCVLFRATHVEVLRLGDKLECRYWPGPQPHGIRAPSVTTAHGNTGSLCHWARPGIKPISSGILVGFITTEPQWELPTTDFFFKKQSSEDISMALRALNHMPPLFWTTIISVLAGGHAP